MPARSRGPSSRRPAQCDSPPAPDRPTRSWSGPCQALAALGAVGAAAVYAHRRPPVAWSAREAVLSHEPRIWLIDNFLSEHEIEALDATGCWEPSGWRQHTCELEASPRLRDSAVMRAIDIRVSEALGVGVNALEHGYIQRYESGFVMDNLHLDQGHAMTPARIASAIIYLDDQPEASGHTVFPFARFSAPPRAATVRTRWEAALQADMLPNRFFRARGDGADVYALGSEACDLGLGIRPRRGAALFFHHRLPSGGETIDLVHGSCGMAQGAPTKRALVKLACDGPIRNTP